MAWQHMEESGLIEIAGDVLGDGMTSCQSKLTRTHSFLSSIDLIQRSLKCKLQELNKVYIALTRRIAVR